MCAECAKGKPDGAAAGAGDGAAATGDKEDGIVPGPELVFRSGFLASAIPTLYKVTLPPSSYGEPMVKVVAGADHVLIQSASGAVLATGSNSFGQLGCDPELFPQSRQLLPVRLPKGCVAADIAAGAKHSVIMLADGQLCAFGDNSHGQLCRPVANKVGDDEAAKDTADKKANEEEAEKAVAAQVTADATAAPPVAAAAAGSSAADTDNETGLVCRTVGLRQPLARIVALGNRTYLWYGEDIVPADVLARAQCTATRDTMLLTYRSREDEINVTVAFNLNSGFNTWLEPIPALQTGNQAALCYDHHHHLLFTLAGVRSVRGLSP